MNDSVARQKQTGSKGQFGPLKKGEPSIAGLPDFGQSKVCAECHAAEAVGPSALCEECSLDRFCPECGERNDSGEGSDGLCGYCDGRFVCPECGDAVDEAGAVCAYCQA